METSVKTINIKPSVEKPTFVPVCLSGNELFIRKSGDTDSNAFYVLRPVDKENLDWRRSDEGIRDYYKEIWQMAVAGDNTELGLSEYIEEDVDLSDRDDDPEWFPNKEADLALVFDEWDGLRELCDGVVWEDTDEEVGTWEDSGWYSPVDDEIQIVFKNNLNIKL